VSPRGGALRQADFAMDIVIVLRFVEDGICAHLRRLFFKDPDRVQARNRVRAADIG
jgi:hypothetical protein